MSSSMLMLDSARVKLEADSGGTAAEPSRLYTSGDVKQELTSTPDLPQPAGLPTIKTEQTVKKECKEESDSDSESIYASSEYSGEFLANESLATENKEHLKHCFVRIKTDPVVELMCNLYRKKQKAFSCICGTSFKLQGCLKRHLKKCTEAGKQERYKENEDLDSFVCAICEAQYTEKESLSRHFRGCLFRLKQKFQGKFFICDICSNRFTNRYYFTLHVKKCMEQGQGSLAIAKKSNYKLPYQCTHCPKRFRVPSALVAHNRYHTGERPFKCEVCGKDFKEGGNFKKHKLTHKYHSEKIFRTCDYCGKNFAFKSDLIKHITLVHMKVKRYSCPICGKKMSSRINRHMLTHFPDKAKETYPCHICKKIFLERSNLRVHMRVHTGEKPYSCRVCSTRFSYLTSLLRHEGSHANKIGNFRCRVCKKLLESRKRLFNHARCHIWQPNQPVKKKGVKSLDCSVNLARVHANWD